MCLNISQSSSLGFSYPGPGVRTISFSQRGQEPRPLSFLHFRVLSPPCLCLSRVLLFLPRARFCPGFCFIAILDCAPLPPGGASPLFWDNPRCSSSDVQTSVTLCGGPPPTIASEPQLIQVVTLESSLELGPWRLPDVSRDNNKQGQWRRRRKRQVLWAASYNLF